jgi:hypothetical protein
VIACFASHVHRVQQILDTAARLGRKVALVGRSMIRNMRVASDLGYLRIPAGLLIPMEDLSPSTRPRTVVLCTGSQGEPFSALTLMAGRDHKWVRIEPGDTVVLSSSLIPGNEAAVYRTINDLARLGADVYHKGNARCTSPARRPGRADPAAGHPAAAQLRARPRRVPAPGPARPAGRLDRGCRASASSSARTATWSSWPTARPAGPARSGPAW